VLVDHGDQGRGGGKRDGAARGWKKEEDAETASQGQWKTKFKRKQTEKKRRELSYLNRGPNRVMFINYKGVVLDFVEEEELKLVEGERVLGSRKVEGRREASLEVRKRFQLHGP